MGPLHVHVFQSNLVHTQEFVRRPNFVPATGFRVVIANPGMSDQLMDAWAECEFTINEVKDGKFLFAGEFRLKSLIIDIKPDDLATDEHLAGLIRAMLLPTVAGDVAEAVFHTWNATKAVHNCTDGIAKILTLLRLWG